MSSTRFFVYLLFPSIVNHQIWYQCDCIPLPPFNKKPYFFLRTKKLDYCLLSNNIMDYRVVAQGKTTIPNVDDGEEFELTDVRHRPVFDPLLLNLLFSFCWLLCLFRLTTVFSLPTHTHTQAHRCYFKSNKSNKWLPFKMSKPTTSPCNGTN